MKTLSRILSGTAVTGMIVVGIAVCISSISNPIWILLLPFAVSIMIMAILAIAVENGRTETKPEDKTGKPAVRPAGPAH